MADPFQIIISSPDGTQRRRFPSRYWQSPSWTIERYGFYADFSLLTSLAFSADSLPNILLGDRVEFWYLGQRRYRGYLSARTPSEDEPQKLILSGYGAALALGKQRCTKRYAFIGGGIDVSGAFAAVCRDFIVGTALPGGVPAVASVQAVPVGIPVTNLDGWDKLFADVAAGLVTASGNEATWGTDVDPSGANRVFLRPTAPLTGQPTHVLPVPGKNIEAASGEVQSADIVNDLLLYGGPPQFPQLLHNGNFELPVVSGEGAGNLVQNGGFEYNNGISNQDGNQTHVDNWTLSGGASTDSDIINTPARATAYAGHRFLVLEPGGAANNVVTQPLIAGHNYTFSVRSAKEIDTQTAYGHALVSVMAGSQSLLSFTVPLTPAGQAWDYFSQTFAAPAGATSVSITLACDGATHVFGQPGGLVCDDVELYDASIVYQDGYQTVAFGEAAFNTLNWVYQDEVREGGYSVYLDVSAKDQNGHDAHLQPPDGTKITVQAGQAVRFGGWVKSPANTPGAPFPAKMLLELEWYKGDGSYDSTIQHVETLGTSVGGVSRVGQWTYIEVTGTAPNGISALQVLVTFRSSGVLLADSFSVRDSQAPAMAAADGSTVQVSPYLPSGNLRFQVDTNSGLLPAGSPYAGSIAAWGRRAGPPVTVDSVLDQAGFLVYADSYFRSHALPLARPSLTIVNDARLYLPGETVKFAGRDGPLLSAAPLPIVRVRESFEDGLLKCAAELSTELPDQTGVEQMLIQQELAKYGPGGTSAASYSDSSNKSSGGGSAGSPVFRTTLAASSTDPTLHDAFTLAPHASQSSQDGWTATTAEVVAARTRTAKGVSSTTLEGRLDAMEQDLAGVSGFAAAAPLTPTGISQILSYNGSLMNIEAVPAFYSGADPAPSVPYTFWQISTDGKDNSDSAKAWTGYDGTSGTTYPGPILQRSLTSGAVRLRVRTENASGAQSAWYTQTADTVYAAPASSGGAVTSVAGRTGDVTLTASDVSGLGTAATHAAGDFDASGAAQTVQAASLQKSANLSDLANAAATRTNLGLGTAATANLPAAGNNASAAQVVRGDDTRLSGSGSGGAGAGNGASVVSSLPTASGSTDNNFYLLRQSGLLDSLFLGIHNGVGVSRLAQIALNVTVNKVPLSAVAGAVVADWRCEDKSGGTLADQAGNTPLTLSASGVFGSDGNGNFWNPSASQYAAHTQSVLTGTGDFSIEVAYNDSQDGTARNLIAAESSGTYAPFDVLRNASNKTYFRMSDVNGTQYVALETAAVLPAKNHIVCCYRASDGRMNFYHNGALAATVQYPGIRQPITGFVLGDGWYNNVSGTTWNGGIYFARVYNADESANAASMYANL